MSLLQKILVVVLVLFALFSNAVAQKGGKKAPATPKKAEPKKADKKKPSKKDDDDDEDADDDDEDD